MTVPTLHVVVRVEAHPTPQFKKVRWMRAAGQGFAAYAIDVGRLGKLAEEVRKRLVPLVAAAKQQRLGESGELLRALAEAGRRLYHAFFSDAENNSTNAHAIRNWLREREHCRISFFVDARVHLPWGLLYDGEVPASPVSPANTTLTDYPHFWCMKYQLGVMYGEMQPESDGAEIPGERFAVIPTLSRTVLERAAEYLAPEDKERLQRYLLSREPVYSKSELKSRWPNVNSQDGVLFFLGHANATQLALAEGDYLSVEDMRELERLNEEDRKTACLVFVNGCCTATGHADGGFLEATGMQGFYGFIGTEANVPDVFALRFGLDFLHRLLCGGEPVYSIMNNLRRQHWPLSLLYSMCCYPELSLAAHCGERLPESFENFSHGTVGTDD